jgi:SDR family mycofactocin-dependent oxidoreductase
VGAVGRVEGKVAFITGAARGQGRAHAVRLASEGADIIAIDICDRIEHSVAEPATIEDLEETANLVEKHGRRIITKQVDVRDFDGLQAALDEGVDELGRLDIVCANAGVWTYKLSHEMPREEWQEIIDIVLTGTWHTTKVAIPKLIEQGEGGCIILTSSMGGIKGWPNLSHYVAAKHGVIGLARSLANELGQYSIRVNAICPGSVETKLVTNQATYDLFAPHIKNPTKEQAAESFATITSMPVPWVQPEDIAGMVLYLASEDGRYVTGTTMSVDAGSFAK